MKKIISRITFVICHLSFVILILTPPVLAQPNLGRIQPPPSIPTTGGNVQGYITNLIATGIGLLVLVAFISAFVWIILAGIKFITSGGDPKQVESARSQITWGIIGLVVVLCAYAIIRVVETFFQVPILSGAFIIG